MELNRVDFGATIFYNFGRELTQQQCIEDLISTFSNEIPSRTTIYCWYCEL